MKINILYIIHVSWNWIKQRPHFIAEGLSNYFNITVMYIESYRRKGYTVNNVEGKLIKIKGLYQIPFKNRKKGLYLLNNYFVKWQINKFIKNNRFDFIWITSPELYGYINSKKSTFKFIYDCMDDVLEFPSVQERKWIYRNLAKLERDLCINSVKVICSSNYLKNKIITRYNLNKYKVEVINNGIQFNHLNSNNDLPINIKNVFKNNKNKKLTYIGTISEWFDFDLILNSLNIIKNIDYVLFGPSTVDIPKHNNIIYCGAIKHELVSTVMKYSDILIMPFKITELIKSVDPVKAYEYIYSGKPIIMVEYEETTKFIPYVHLYKTSNDYINILKKLIKNDFENYTMDNKYYEYLYDADWNCKVKQIVNILYTVRKELDKF